MMRGRANSLIRCSFIALEQEKGAPKVIEDHVQSTAFDDSNLQSEVICEEIEVAKYDALGAIS